MSDPLIPVPAAYYHLTATEAEFQAAVIEMAHVTRWRVYHTHDSRRSPHGFPDLVLVRKERLVFAELKSEYGRVTVPQLHWLDALEQVPGVEAFLWRPHNWAEIEKVLAR